MEGVFFRLWVGTNYQRGGFRAKRVLILGESHYRWDEKIPLTEGITVQCVEERIGGDATHPFWTKIAVTFLNKQPSVQDKRGFWGSVAFYNFVQADVGFGARVRPTDEMWAQSEPGFLGHRGSRPSVHHRSWLATLGAPAFRGRARTFDRRSGTQGDLAISTCQWGLGVGLRNPAPIFRRI